jgi:hypothetical protein
MNRSGALILAIAVLMAGRAVAQDVVTMDDEPHYARLFANDKCQAYVVSLDRLEQTKPVIHEHDFARMPLAGVVEQAWSSTLFTMKPYDDSYYILFSFPVDRVTLRNPRNEPYREIIVEVLRHDTTPMQFDPDTGFYFYPYPDSLGPGVDPHVSYITSLTNTSVEIMNVQLTSGDSKLRPEGERALLVAMTDLDLLVERKDGLRKELHLAQGEVKWLANSTGSFKNTGKQTARFAIFGMK